MNLVVDASAILAIVFSEADADEHLAKLLNSTQIWMSPVNWWEVQARVHSVYGDRGLAKTDALLARLGVAVEPVTAEQARIALAAFTRYRSRPVRLNMGDCFAYALAREKSVPLLYKGDNFRRTDVEGA